MGSGNSGLYSGSGSSPQNGKDFNTSGSSSVKRVDSVSKTKDLHSVPSSGTPNSVSKNYKNGKLDSERYYGKDGKAYLDIDYSNHGNSKTHPNVPHEHKIHFDENGKMHRDNEPKGGLRK